MDDQRQSTGSASPPTSTPSTTTSKGTTRSKMNYACEACRLAKVKCQPGGLQAGVCKRCTEFKRECVFRTGPRTRRSKYAHTAATPLPPPPGPSQTFSINFDMPAADEPESDFDFLRSMHERNMSSVYVSSEDDDDQAEMSPDDISPGPHNTTFSFNDMSTKPPRPRKKPDYKGSRMPISDGFGKSQPMGNLAIKPQFNLESAARLVECFKAMLMQCPIMVLPASSDVRLMARECPFVLLAILAVTSCTTSLQGYSLYDEEFRKVLGLKFVAGGERSLELLQGLLIYCAWYPFHLRPKSRHGFQYIRMAADIVQDLELDQEEGTQIPAEDRLAAIRVYLGCFYTETTWSNAWGKPPTISHSSWLVKCCNMLEQSSELDQDHILVWLIRFQQINSEYHHQFRSYREGSSQDRYQRDLVRLGLISRCKELQNNMPSRYSGATSIVMCTLFTDLYLMVGTIMSTPKPSVKPDHHATVSPVDLLNTTHIIRTFLDFLINLTDQELSIFSAPDLARVILMMIAAVRLSFPLPMICPGFDYRRASNIINLDEYLAKICEKPEDGNGNEIKSNERDNKNGQAEESGSKTRNNVETRKGRTDVGTALRVVIASLRKSYNAKVAARDAKEAKGTCPVSADKAYRPESGIRVGCPMLNGSLDDYIATWGGQKDHDQLSRFYQGYQRSAVPQSQQQVVHHESSVGSFHDSTASAPLSSLISSTGYPTSQASNQSPMTCGSNEGMNPATTSTVSDPSSFVRGDSYDALLSEVTPSYAMDSSRNLPSIAPDMPPAPVVFNDLWDAMTLGWTDADMVDVIGGDFTLPEEPGVPHLVQENTQ